MLVASKPSDHPVSVSHSAGVIDIGDHAQLLLCGFWELNSAKIDLHLLCLQAKYFIDCAFSPATHYSVLILNIPALLTNILIITVFKLCLLLTPTMMALRAVKKKKVPNWNTTLFLQYYGQREGRTWYLAGRGFFFFLFEGLIFLALNSRELGDYFILLGILRTSGKWCLCHALKALNVVWFVCLVSIFPGNNSYYY